MTDALFRREVLEARRTHRFGGISLVQPLRSWLLTVAAALAATTLVLFLAMGSYTRRSTVGGHLVPGKGLATVVAPTGGVLARLHVGEGDRVEEGQGLAVVVVPRLAVGEGDTLAALEQRLGRRRDGLLGGLDAQRQRLSAQQAGIAAQIAVARRELAQVEAEIGTRHEQVRIAEETLQRLRRLEDERYVSLLQVRQQESSALAWRAELQVLQRQAIVIRRGIVQLGQALDELPGQARAAEAGFERDLALLEQEQVEVRARGALSVAAPVDGMVSAQWVKPGQSVQAGQPLLSLLPAGDRLEAELLVPSRAIGFVAPGDAVLLRYQAFPYQKFGHHRGRVVRVGRSAFGAGEPGAMTGHAQAGEPYYRVTVALPGQAILAYGNEEALKPGMLLEADILGERRRLIEWVFEPLYSIHGRVGGDG